MCDVMVFLRRGREREARRTKTGQESQDRDIPDRAGEGRGDRTQWCLSLYRAEYFSIVLILGAIIANVLRCFTGYLV